MGSIQLDGGIRAPPVVDPWTQSLVWIPTHANQLVITNPYTALTVAKIDLPSPSSAAVVFDKEGKKAMVCCLDGWVVCFNVTLEGCKNEIGSLSSHGRQTQDDTSSETAIVQVALQQEWIYSCQTATFSPAAPVVVGAKGPAEVVAVAAVNGQLHLVNAATGQKRAIFKLSGPVFIPILVLKLYDNTGVSMASSVESAPKKSCTVVVAGAAYGMLDILPLDFLLHPGNNNNNNTNSDGAPIEDGEFMKHRIAFPIGEKITGLAALEETGWVVIATASGVVCIVQLHLTNGKIQVKVVDAVQLPGQVYCTPGVAGNRVAIGCRDDHVYVLDVECGSERSE